MGAVRFQSALVSVGGVLAPLSELRVVVKDLFEHKRLYDIIGGAVDGAVTVGTAMGSGGR